MQLGLIGSKLGHIFEVFWMTCIVLILTKCMPNSWMKACVLLTSWKHKFPPGVKRQFALLFEIRVAYESSSPQRSHLGWQQLCWWYLEGKRKIKRERAKNIFDNGHIHTQTVQKADGEKREETAFIKHRCYGHRPERPILLNTGGFEKVTRLWKKSFPIKIKGILEIVKQSQGGSARIFSFFNFFKRPKIMLHQAPILPPLHRTVT